MLSRWRINMAPTAKDPERRLLEVKGALRDIHSLIRRFGALCGRPKKERSDALFNFRLYLHGVTAENIAELEAELKSMGGEKIGDAAPGVAAAPVTPIPAPVTPIPAPATPIPAEPANPLPGLEIQHDEPGAPATGAASVPAPDRRVNHAEAPVCGAVMQPQPELSMEALLVAGFNRFAHAALMSVMSSPGTMYNPLYISGPAGSGKSHMLNALAIKLQEQAPGQPVLLTGGARLARAVEAGLANQHMQKLFDFAQTSNALIIDDVHLLGVTEENRQGLADLVGAYTSAEKQIVLASVYPLKLLGGIDEALQFKFHAGHAVEIKTVGEAACGKIAAAALERRGFKRDAPGCEMFALKLAEDFAHMQDWLDRLSGLIALRSAAGVATTLTDAQGILFGVETEPAAATSEEAKAALARAAKPPDGPLATRLYFPEGHEDHVQWVWRQLYAAAQKNRWPFPFTAASRTPYQLEPLSAAPFVVSADCLGAMPNAALVLGPPPGSGLAEHEGDFKYALGHLLTNAGIRLGWMNFQRVKDPQSLIRTYLDLTPRGAV